MLQLSQLHGFNATSGVDNTKFLSHFDGTNGSTTFVDVYGHTITPTGTSALDTSVKKFGTASVHTPGTGNYISFAGADLVLGSSDFTLDYWVNAANLYAAYGNQFSKQQTRWSSSSGIYIRQGFGGDTDLYCSVGNGTTGISLNGGIGSYSPTTMTWIALQRRGNTFTFWINGVRVNQVTSALGALDDNASVVLGSGPVTGLDGYFDEMRIVVGQAMFNDSGNISVPTSAY